MTTVVYGVSSFRSVSFHTADSKLYNLPTTSQCVNGFQRLPTDPAGQTTVTFDGVPAGAEIRVTYGMTDLAGVESCVANQSLSWDVYAAGSPLNTVRVLIIHMEYGIKDFSYTSKTGEQTIPVQLSKDKWAYNPA